MARARLTAAAAPLLLLLAGCGGDAATVGSGDPTAEQPLEETPSPTAAPLTKAEVNGAIRAFAQAGTGSYYVRGTLAAEAPAATHTGRYDLSTGYADEFVSITGPGEPVSKVRTIAIERDSWIQVATDEVETCWMRFTPDDFETFGVDLGAGSLGIPPVAYVVSTLEAEEDGSVTSDLYSVLLMFSGKTPRVLGIAPDASDRVAVSLDLEDGAIEDIRVSPGQLVGALEEAGVDLGPLEQMRDDLAVSVQLKESGDPVEVERPPKEFRVEVTDQEQLEQDRAECDQRLADSP